MGEGAGLIYSVDAAEKITRDVAREAEEQLDSLNKLRTCVGIPWLGARLARFSHAFFTYKYKHMQLYCSLLLNHETARETLGTTQQFANSR